MPEVFSSASLLAEFSEAIQQLSERGTGSVSGSGAARLSPSPASRFQRELDLLALRTAYVCVSYLDTRQERISHEFPDGCETAVEKARHLNKDDALQMVPIPMPELPKTGTAKTRGQNQGRHIELGLGR
tara:strand:+ start:372 stop:758 length:387 start_codon:yes stop_codon:yes gene_type:complete